mgnify:CR=1 FL=1
MDAELESNEELSAAFAEAQEAAFNNAVLAVWAERIKSFKDSFIPVFGDACKDAACRFGFSKDGSNTFKSAVDAFAANICDLYGAAPQIVDGFCEFLARNACLEFDATPPTCPCPASSTCRGHFQDGLPAGDEQRPRVQARHGRIRGVRREVHQRQRHDPRQLHPPERRLHRDRERQGRDLDAQRPRAAGVFARDPCGLQSTKSSTTSTTRSARYPPPSPMRSSRTRSMRRTPRRRSPSTPPRRHRPSMRAPPASSRTPIPTTPSARTG